MNNCQILNRLIAIGPVCLLLAGCASRVGSSVTSSGSNGSIPIAFVTNNASDYWLIAEGGVSDAAKRLGPGYRVEFVMPYDGSIGVQEEDVERLIASGCKAIAISPVDAKVQTPWLDLIAGRTMLITQDSDASGSMRLAYIGTDNHAAGLLAGQFIKKALPNGGKIVLLVGNRDAQNAHDREMGIRDALAGTNIDIVDVYADRTDRSLAKSNALNAISAIPDLAMEVGLWSYNGPAILSAVQQAGKLDKVKIVCFDQEKATLAGVKSKAIYATIVQQPYQFSLVATELLATLAGGDKSGLPKGGIHYFPAEAVTSANVDKYIAELDTETHKKWGYNE